MPRGEAIFAAFLTLQVVNGFSSLFGVLNFSVPPCLFLIFYAWCWLLAVWLWHLVLGRMIGHYFVGWMMRRPFGHLLCHSSAWYAQQFVTFSLIGRLLARRPLAALYFPSGGTWFCSRSLFGVYAFTVASRTIYCGFHRYLAVS